MKISYTVSRSIIIEAGPRRVYSLARDMNQARTWSPWFVLDNQAEPEIIAGDGKRVGSIHRWDTPLLGSGEQEIVALKPGKMIEHDLRFFAPFKSTARAVMTFKKVKKGTKVTWTLESALPFFMAPMRKMFMALIRKDYERGLLMLKQQLEIGKVPTKVSYEGVVEATGFRYVGIKTQTTTKRCGSDMARDITKLDKFLKTQKIKTDRPFSIYHKYDFVTEKCVYTIGFMVSEVPKKLPAGFIKGRVRGGKAFCVLHKGAYENLGNAWTGGMMYLRAHKIKQRRGVQPMEVYLNDPQKVQPGNVRTRIYLPVK